MEYNPHITMLQQQGKTRKCELSDVSGWQTRCTYIETSLAAQYTFIHPAPPSITTVQMYSVIMNYPRLLLCTPYKQRITP